MVAMAVNCPFCAEEIKPEAVVCKHCRRDLSIVKPVYEEIRGLKSTVDGLRTEIAELRAALERARATAPVGVDGPLPAPLESSGGASIAMVGVFALLLIAHYLIIIRLDLDTVVLRVASIALPMLCAILVPALRRQSLAFGTGAAVLLGVAAVAAMSTVVSVVDKVALLPANAREWREIVEYMASISLSYIAGALLVAAVAHGGARRAKPNATLVGVTARLHKLVDSTVTTAESLEKRAQTLQNLVSATAPALAAAGAVATGLRSLLP
jgi:hypothetical protein